MRCSSVRDPRSRDQRAKLTSILHGSLLLGRHLWAKKRRGRWIDHPLRGYHHSGCSISQLEHVSCRQVFGWPWVRSSTSIRHRMRNTADTLADPTSVRALHHSSSPSLLILNIVVSLLPCTIPFGLWEPSLQLGRCLEQSSIPRKHRGGSPWACKRQCQPFSSSASGSFQRALVGSVPKTGLRKP